MHLTTTKYNQLMERVNRALDTIRPHLQVDGGNVELVEISDDLLAKVKWMGRCEGCSMSLMTMKAGIEQTVRQQVPEIRGVEAINGLGVK